MFKKIAVAFCLISALSISSANARHWHNKTAAPEDQNQAQTAMDDGSGSQLIKCWGWDGSAGGNDVKKMTRDDCLAQHGTVTFNGSQQKRAELNKKVIESQPE